MPTRKPWEGYIKPAKIFGNLYFVGTQPSSVHLIDTGAGLILIDSGYLENLYLVIQNIWELGFDPRDIKYILHSHGHYDHVNATSALVALAGAKTFIGEDDLKLVTGKINHFDEQVIPFTPDVLLRDGDVITLGNTSIRCVSSPGHSDGVMSFFFDVTDGEKSYRAGMFGGVGTNTLLADFLKKNSLSFENRDKFFKSIEKLRKERVDIFIGNHVGNNDTEGKLKKAEAEKSNPFIDSKAWGEFLTLCESKLKRIIEKGE